jgi:RNase H-fold protein (predicted Holliday junction resolvase)
MKLGLLKFEPGQIITRLNKILRRSLSSTLILMLVCLALVDAAVLTFRPLKYIHTTKFIPIDQNPIISKIPEFLANDKKPEVIVLGSSLPMVALGYADLTYGPIPDFQLNVRTYTKARYFTHCLNQQMSLKNSSNGKITVGNLTVSGCMISDAYLILERTLAEHKIPKMVIIGIAPRDFIDNVMPACGQTPAFEVLANWTGFDDILRNDVSLADGTNYILDRLWYFYRTKTDYRFLAVTWTADILNRPVSFYDAIKKEKEKQEASKITALNLNIAAIVSDGIKNGKSTDAFAESIDIYKMRYNPPNFNRYKQELRYFEKLLSLCKNKQIACIVVNMPITNENKQLLNAQLFQKYSKDTSLLTQSYNNAQYIDLDADNTFVNTDFEDCVHVNEIGAKKVVDKLVKRINSKLVI